MADLPLNSYLANFPKSPSICIRISMSFNYATLYTNLDRKLINQRQQQIRKQHEIRAYNALAIHLTVIIKILNLKNMKTKEKVSTNT